MSAALIISGIRRSTPTNDKEKPLNNPDHRPPFGQENPIPWSQFQDQLLALYTPPMVAPATRRKIVAAFKALEIFSPATTADLTISLITDLTAGRPKEESRYTLHSRLADLRTICSFAEKAGYLRISPFRLRKLSNWVRLPSLDAKRHLSRQEIRAILDLMAKHVEQRTGWPQWRARRLLAVTSIIAYTGIRKMECLRLRVADVDLAARAIWIRPHDEQLKTDWSEAPVPIPGAMAPILTSWLEHRMDAPRGFALPKTCPYLIPTLNRKSPWVEGAPGTKPLDRFQRVASMAGVEGATFQMLRRSWATHAEFHGMGEAMITRVLRHTTTRTAKKHYRKADLVNMSSAVNGFDF